MRYLLALPVLAALFLATGCEERTNMRELPDRQGHAYQTAAAERPIAAGVMVPYADEQVYTVQAGDTLRTVAARFGVSVEFLIKRNDLKNNVLAAGQALIVPKPKK